MIPGLMHMGNRKVIEIRAAKCVELPEAVGSALARRTSRNAAKSRSGAKVDALETKGMCAQPPLTKSVTVPCCQGYTATVHYAPH